MIKLFYWAPRILSLLFIVFLSIFAFDVFEEYQGWAVVPALLMHLLPSFVLSAATGIAWKFDLVGAVFFLAFAALYILIVGLDRHWSWYASVSLPSAIVGILYLLSWRQKKNSSPAV